MNNITVVGQLGRDSEVRHLQNGDAVCGFSVADNQGGKDKPTLWWSCVLFGKRAETLSQYLVKGQQVSVSGSLTKRIWKDKEGNEREALELRVVDVALQGGRPQESPQKPAAKKPFGGGDNFQDSDIPFAPLPRKALLSI